MICNYEDSESGNSFPCDNDNESLDDSSLKDLMITNEELMKLHNQGGKKSISPDVKYSRRNIMHRIHSEKKEMPLKLSSSPLSIKSETLKSPKIGKRNYILKTELSSLKVHTPSVNQNENPLFNYYNFSSSSEQNCNTILNIDEPHSYDYKEENVYNSQSNNQTNDSSGKNFYKDESDGSFRSMPSSSQNENKIHNVTINNNYINQINFPFQIPNCYLNEENDINFSNGCISQKNKKQNVSINDYSIEEIILNARELASEQNGCRLLQKQIELHPEYGNELFDSLENDLLTLSSGSFGNYLLQKLICVISLNE